MTKWNITRNLETLEDIFQYLDDTGFEIEQDGKEKFITIYRLKKLDGTPITIYHVDGEPWTGYDVIEGYDVSDEDIRDTILNQDDVE
jgi:hypothetical protein